MAAGTEQDIMTTMLMAASDIKSLRKQNEILSAQMQVVNIFAAALGFKQSSQGMGEDIAWRLEKHIEAIKEDIQRKTAVKEDLKGVAIAMAKEDCK